MPTAQDVGSHAARELKLYTENESRLHRKRIAPYKRLLSYRWQAGTYDPTRAVVGWRHIVREAAKQYEIHAINLGADEPHVTDDVICDVAGQLEHQYAEEMRVNGGAGMTSLVDAIQAELRPYYSAEWSRERANNLAMACSEPDVRLGDIESMLRASGDRPAPWDAVAQRPLDRHQACQLAGNILATALAQTNRKLRLAAF